MEKVFIKDNYLHILFDYYDYGYQQGTEVVPIKEINFVRQRVGVRGGKHGFDIMSKKEVDVPTHSNAGEEKYETLASFFREHHDLMSEVVKALKPYKIKAEIVIVK